MFKSDGYEIHLIGAEVKPDDIGEDLHFNPIKYLKLHRLVRSVLHIPVSVISLWLYCRKYKPNILFCVGGVFYNGLAILICSKVFNIKCIVRTAEDHFNYWKYVSTLQGKLRHYLITNLLSLFVLKHVDYVLTVGVESQKYFSDKLGSKGNVFGIPGTIREDDFFIPENRIDCKKEIGYKSEDQLILYVGAISGVKGADMLPDIIGNVLKKKPNAKFHIIGSETESRSKIINSIKDIGKAAVKINSPMNNRELKKYYQAADALVFLTRVGVGYGLVNIEATLCGLPIVAYNSGRDVKWFLGDNCKNSIEEIIDTIVDETYEQATIPANFKTVSVWKEHIALFNNLFG